jgi:hypothetical protein
MTINSQTSIIGAALMNVIRVCTISTTNKLKKNINL